MSYKKTGNKNGRPLSERNQLIIADSKAGMTSEQLAKKYGITQGYAQKLASEYKRKTKVKADEEQKSGTTRLYAERDHEIMKFMQTQGKGVLKVIGEDTIRKNKFYTPRAKS
jgi:transposase